MPGDDPKNRDRTYSNKIRYIIVLADETLEVASLFQGISPSMMDMEWALKLVATLPTDVLEFGLSLEARTGRRLTAHGWSWTPLTLSNFVKLTIPMEDPFWVVMTGSDKTFAGVAEWERRQKFPVLKVSTIGKKSLRPKNTRWTHVREHLARVAQVLRVLDQRFPIEDMSKTLSAWRAPEAPVLDLVAKPHNSTIANLVTLQSLGYRFKAEAPLASPPGDERPHVNAMEETARAVIAVQDDVGFFPALMSHPPKPDRIVLAPALYAHTRERLPKPEPDDPPGLRETIRLLQQQTGYIFHGAGKALAPMMLPAGQFVLDVRMRELHVQTAAAALRSASTIAATIRLPNGVNLTPELSNFTGYARGDGSNARNNKGERVFQSVQTALAKHTPAQLLDIVASSQSGVKLIADAPLEWLPVGDLPMSIALDVSRIPATPGNLMITQLARIETLYLDPDAFSEVLVISSFGTSDPIRNDVRHAMAIMASNSSDRLKIRQVTVNSTDEFVTAINDFHGAMMVFDGHGSHDKISGVGALHVGSEKIDVWQLRGRIRPPPVVVLSACDTQSPDRTHVTAGSGFLTCGATAVVGTFLPVRSKSAALFAARLALRAAWYTHAVVGGKRPILWSEVFGGMLRLDYLSDLMGRLEREKLVTQASAIALRNEVNMHVHTRDPDWWPQVKQKLQAASGLDDAAMKSLISKTVAEGDSVRYTHIGNPDLLCITSAEVLNPR